MVVVNIAIYTYVVNSLKISIYHKLEAIRDLKVNELNHWLDERITDIRTIADDAEVRLPDRSQGRRDRARAVITRYLQHYDEFHEISIVSPYTQGVLVSTEKSIEGNDLPGDASYEKPWKSTKLFIGDIYYSTLLNNPCMAVAVPILSSGDMEHVIGILIGKINLESSLYRLLSNRTGIGSTGETLIVNKDIIAINELRWHRDAVLKLKLGSRPAVEASLGKTGN
jgi:hypothetical protein